MAPFMNSIILKDCFLSFLISITLISLLLLTRPGCINMYECISFISANVSELSMLYAHEHTYAHVCAHAHMHTHTQYTCMVTCRKNLSPTYSVLESIQNNKLPRKRENCH